MKILLTGATGYIGQRLLPVLLDQGHTVICMVRDKTRFDIRRFGNCSKLEIIQADLLDAISLRTIPTDIDAAYYLVHSMGTEGNFAEKEQRSAQNFKEAIDTTSARQIIYLSGIVNSSQLSKHLRSRKNVETILNQSTVPVTTLRAGIIIGSGSGSFEIIRDLVEKLPVMIAPKWLRTRCQPVAIRNVIEFLRGILGNESTFGNHYDLYGPDTLTYKQMLLQYARVRGLKRLIITVPVMTPRLSSYWLYFVTSTSYPLAKNLVDSMSVEVVGKKNDLAEQLGVRLIPYQQAIQLAFDKIEQNLVLSSWYDALGSEYSSELTGRQLEVPTKGVLSDQQALETNDPAAALTKIFAIGGQSGWYYGNWLWEFRGFIDRMFGGVGLRRGRKNKDTVHIGDRVDFWRVLYSDPEQGRLLLYAEMKLPGEAWLEFSIKDTTVSQVATFRPLGLWGRLYWYAMLPFHYFIFRGMIRKIAGK